MRLYPNTLYLCRQGRGLLSLLPLISVTLLLAVLLTGWTGVAASRTTFQSSPVDTPTHVATNTPVPPTNTPVRQPTDTTTPVRQPTNTTTPVLVNTPTASPTIPSTRAETPSAKTPTPVSIPTGTATVTSQATPTVAPPIGTPVSGTIQMPLLPPTATLKPAAPTPTATPRLDPLLSPDSIGLIVVIVIVLLVTGVGLFFGRALRNLAQRS